MQSSQHSIAPPPDMSSNPTQPGMFFASSTQPDTAPTPTPTPGSIPAVTFSRTPTPTSSPSPLWPPQDIVEFTPPVDVEIRRRGMGRSTKLAVFPIKQSLYHIGAIVFGNTLCIVFVIVCLYTASQHDSISAWEKRGFNFSLILFTAILSLGIGNFVDELGLLSRGKVLATNAHTELSVQTPHLSPFTSHFSSQLLSLYYKHLFSIVVELYANAIPNCFADGIDCLYNPWINVWRSPPAETSHIPTPCDV